jgi:type II restriction/modification system DNA methylase subunit YeeA
MSQQEQQDKSQYFYRASAADFMKIPGAPTVYWASKNIYKTFLKGTFLSEIAELKAGMSTGDNSLFQRYWFEVSLNNIEFNRSSEYYSQKVRWFPCNSGGEYRKWYGNNEFVVNWLDNGLAIKSHKSSAVRNESYYFKSGLTYSKISSGSFAARFKEAGFAFDDTGRSINVKNKESELPVLAVLCSKVAKNYLDMLAPSMSFTSKEIGCIPVLDLNKDLFYSYATRAVNISKITWDSYEFSWCFLASDLLLNTGLIKNAYLESRKNWLERTEELKRIEYEVNRELINVYGLHDEINPDVSIEDITLNCNPYYRYGVSRSETELESFLQCDTIKELISYSVGNMMGRYSIDKPGLILASQGETIQDYLNQIPNPRFMPDSDAILPLTDQEWFADDVTNRVREFVKVVWGEETLQENLAFIAESLCLHAIKPKKSEGALDTIRRYLSTQFYKDHLKTYKKRPIYWLFSSGKEKAFECLVYLHRYNESTLARMRTEYVTPLMGKYDAQHGLLVEQKASASPQQQRDLEKEIKALEKKQTELRAFDEQLKHYADMRIKLDLDDGVKVNYGKFGNLLAEVKAVTGDKGD